MRKRILLLIALALGLSTQIHADTPVTDPVAVAAAMVFVCDNLGVDCSDVPLPHIDYLQELAWWGWLGAYDPLNDPEGIWLNPGYYGLLKDSAAVEPQAFATLVHEMTHYVEWRKVYNEDIEVWSTPEVACHIEGVAFSVERHWLELIGWQEYADELAGWRTWYNGCEPDSRVEGGPADSEGIS